MPTLCSRSQDTSIRCGKCNKEATRRLGKIRYCHDHAVEQLKKCKGWSYRPHPTLSPIEVVGRYMCKDCQNVEKKRKDRSASAEGQPARKEARPDLEYEPPSRQNTGHAGNPAEHDVGQRGYRPAIYNPGAQERYDPRFPGYIPPSGRDDGGQRRHQDGGRRQQRDESPEQRDHGQQRRDRHIQPRPVTPPPRQDRDLSEYYRDPYDPRNEEAARPQPRQDSIPRNLTERDPRYYKRRDKRDDKKRRH
jgi:hypothetical protein